MTNIDEMSINAIRVLSADAIQKANSGHPGLPLGTAPTAYELWTNHMNYNPADPKWENRDRFVLSGGHGSMLLYSLFHLLGIGNLSLDDVKNFRQMGSKTPGHPEYGHTVGVEATTGPLGQGMAMAVGMAMAEAHLASVFNKEGYNVVDHYTYVLGGDGRQKGQLCPTFARCRTRTGLGSNFKVEIGSGPVTYGLLQKSEIEKYVKELLDYGFIRNNHSPFLLLFCWSRRRIALRECAWITDS